MYTPFRESASAWENPAAPMSRDITTLVSTRVIICKPAEPMVMGMAMDSSCLAVRLKEDTPPPPEESPPPGMTVGIVHV